MVLLGDIVGEDDAVVAAATSEVVRLANARSGEGFIAVSSEARKKFWLVPLIGTLLILSLMIAIAEFSTVAPFIYTLF